MGMSTHAVGFRPPDETWMKHKVVWDACKAAGVPVPRATCTFFGDTEPDPSGVVVEIEGTPAVRKWRDEGQEGFEIELSKLPEGIKIVRVYNAW